MGISLRRIRTTAPRSLAKALAGVFVLILIRTQSRFRPFENVGWLRETAEKKGLPYQSPVNQILAEEMKKAS
jgi:hypothetical protein